MFTVLNGWSVDGEDLVGTVRIGIVVSAGLALVGCNQSDSGNVMASHANALTPAQVDLALGPEIANASVNQSEPVNDVNAVVSANATQAADEEDALDEAVPAEPPSEPSTSNNSAEPDGVATE